DPAGRAAKPHLPEMEYAPVFKVAYLLALDPEPLDPVSPDTPQRARALMATVDILAQASLDGPEILNVRVLQSNPRLIVVVLPRLERPAGDLHVLLRNKRSSPSRAKSRPFHPSRATPTAS